MDDQVLKIRELFEEFLPHFGISHAKVFRSLMHGEVKTARQLCVEADVSYHKVYSLLKDLVEQGVVECINSNPANYYIEDSLKVFDDFLSKKKLKLEKSSKEFENLFNGKTKGIWEKEYSIKLNEKQFTLFDSKSKLPVKETQETRELIERLTNYKNGLEPKNQYNYAIYR